LPAAARALLSWARSIDPAVLNLGDLGRRLSDNTQVTSVAELERALYGGGAVDDLHARLVAAFRNGPDLSQSIATVSPLPLPPLYPFRT